MSQADDFASSQDWGASWIENFLHNSPAPEGLSPYLSQGASLAHGLKHVLGIFNTATLVLAAFILLYHIIGMTVETAHSGVPFGRRTDPVWTPLRILLALGFLIPMSDGLSAGQYLIAKIAMDGSQLASRAWEAVVQEMFTKTPEGIEAPLPSLNSFVKTATEMEVCRLIYMQSTTAAPTDNALRLVGNIDDITKIPQDLLSSEVWRYTNKLDTNAPLCGELRFVSPHLTLTSTAEPYERIASSLAEFSRVQSDQVLTSARSLALTITPSIVTGSVPDTLTVQSSLSAMENNLLTHLKVELTHTQDLQAQYNHPLAKNLSTGGWIGAGILLPTLNRRQEAYAAMLQDALPMFQAPVLAHPLQAQQVLTDDLKTQFWAPKTAEDIASKLMPFYGHVSQLTTMVHAWLANSASSINISPIQASDLRDQITAATEAEIVLSLFAKAIDHEAIAMGVWGIAPRSNDVGYPFSSSSPPGRGFTPLLLLAEFGRRQFQAGLHLITIAGPLITISSATTAALLMGLVGASFMAGASLLTVVLPFLIFFRFMIGVIGWGLSFFEALAAVPLSALAHITPTGEGLAGSLARQSYMLWLSLWMRPLLTLIGFIVGLILLNLGLSLLILTLKPLIYLTNSHESSTPIMTNLSLVMTFDVLCFGLANAAFKSISYIPDHILNWITPYVTTEGLTSQDHLPPPSGSSSHTSTQQNFTTHLKTLTGNITAGSSTMRESTSPQTQKTSTAEARTAGLMMPEKEAINSAHVSTNSLPSKTDATPSPNYLLSEGKAQGMQIGSGSQATDSHRNDAFFSEKGPINKE